MINSRKRIALKMPKNPITIHEKPKESRIPVGPNVNGNLLTGGMRGAAFGLILAILIGVRRKFASSKTGLENE